MCPSRESCLQYAIDENINHGIWGGCTEAGRRSMKRKMAGRGRPEGISLDPPTSIRRFI
jgi:hypothetical protein